ncbi:DUF6049 family protein [Actinomycetaceae bacterium L2_0104]
MSDLARRFSPQAAPKRGRLRASSPAGTTPSSVNLRQRILAFSLATCTLFGLAAPGAAASTARQSGSASQASSVSQSSPLAADLPAVNGTVRAPLEDGDISQEVPAVRITSVGSPLLESGQDLRVRAEITNPLEEPISITGISLLGQDWTPDTRSRVLRFLEGGPAALSLLQHLDTTQEDFAVQSIAAGESASFDFTVPREELGWSDSFDSWGPRGIEVEAQLGDGTELSDRSLVVVSPGTELTPMPTGVVVPVTQSATDLAGHSDLAETLAQPDPSAGDQGPQQAPSTGATGAEPEEGASADITAEASNGSGSATEQSEIGGEERAAETLSALQIPGVTVALDPSYLPVDDPENSTEGSTEEEEAAEAEAPSSQPHPVQEALDSFTQASGTELLLTSLHDVDAQPLVHAGALDEVRNAYAQATTSATSQESKPRTDIALLPAGSDQQTAAALSSLDISGVILPDNDIPQNSYRYATASARTDLLLEVDGEGRDIEIDDDVTAVPALAVDSVSSAALSNVLANSEEGSGEGSGLNTSRELDTLDSRQLVLSLSAVTYRERPNDPRAMLLSLDRAGLPYYSDPNSSVEDPTDSEETDGRAEENRRSTDGTSSITGLLGIATISDTPEADGSTGTDSASNGEAGANGSDTTGVTTTVQPLDLENVQGTLEALMNAPWVEPTTVSELLNLEPSEISRAPLAEQSRPDSVITESQIATLQSSLSTIQNYANLSPAPASLVDPTRDAIGSTLAIGWRADSPGRTQQVNEIRDAADSFFSVLQVRPSSTINIISQATELPIHVSNDLSVPVGVVIELDSHDNRLVQKNQVTVTLPPNQVTSVSLPVTARGSGNIQVVIRILDPTGQEIGTEQTLDIRVRADWENVGTLVIAIALGLVLVFGVIKSLRRGQKHAPVDPADYVRARREGYENPDDDDTST